MLFRAKITHIRLWLFLNEIRVLFNMGILVLSVAVYDLSGTRFRGLHYSFKRCSTCSPGILNIYLRYLR